MNNPLPPNPPIDPMKIIELVQKNRNVKLAGNDKLRLKPDWLSASVHSVAASAVNCGDLTTQSGMNQCAAAEYKKSDQALNQGVCRYRSGLDEGQKRQLMEVQRAGSGSAISAASSRVQASRVAACILLLLANCMTEMTEQRIRELQVLEICGRSDLLCPSRK